MGRVHRLGQRTHQRRRLPRRQRILRQHRIERAAAAEFQGHERPAVVFADLEDLDDARMLQACDRLGLRLEALDLDASRVGPGKDHLQGTGSVQTKMAGKIDHAHAAAAQLAFDDVAGRGTSIGGF